METTGQTKNTINSANDGNVLDVEKLVALENMMESKLVEAYKVPSCDICGKPTTKKDRSSQYRKTCSQECLEESRHRHAQKNAWRMK